MSARREIKLVPYVPPTVGVACIDNQSAPHSKPLFIALLLHFTGTSSRRWRRRQPSELWGRKAVSRGSDNPMRNIVAAGCGFISSHIFLARCAKRSRVGMDGRKCGVERTRGKGLLQLVSLVGLLQGQSVDEALAADLELDLLGLAVALDPGG